MDTYKPVRDRGVYRAAANPKNPNHKWAKDLVDSSGTIGVMRWIYRQRGWVNLMKELVYSKNPFLSLVDRDGLPGAYLPVPLKFE